MDLKAYSPLNRVIAIRGAALVACAIGAFTTRASAQDRSAMERVMMEQRRQNDAPKGWFGVTVNENGAIDENGNPFYTGYPVVTSVEPESPADKAGVKVGDILLTFNDHDMKGSAMALGRWLQPGASFVVQLRRDGAAKQVRGTVGTRPAEFDKRVTLIWTTPEGGGSMSEMSGGSGMSNPTVRMTIRTPMPSKLPPVLAPSFTFGGGVYPFAGAEFTALNPDLSDALNVGKEGVFVTRVLEGSPARIAGLRGGDVVLTADAVRLVNPLTLVRVIRENEDHSMRLGIIRKKKPETIILKW